MFSGTVFHSIPCYTILWPSFDHYNCQVQYRNILKGGLKQHRQKQLLYKERDRKIFKLVLQFHPQIALTFFDRSLYSYCTYIRQWFQFCWQTWFWYCQRRCNMSKIQHLRCKSHYNVEDVDPDATLHPSYVEFYLLRKLLVNYVFVVCTLQITWSK